MTFKTDMTTDLFVFFNTDEFAETVTYAGEEIEAVVEREEDPDDYGGADRVATAKLFVKVSDVGDPGYRDQVVIDSTTWRVMQVLSGDGYVWVLKITKDERPNPWT